MEEENDKNDEFVIERTSEDSTLTFDGDGRPEPLITIKDNHVNVKTFKVAMSRRHRIIMFMDIWTIAWVAGLGVYMSMVSQLSQYVWIIAPIGVLVLLCAIGKTIVDFQNWLFTMNSLQAQMGEWYLEDIVGICQDFINAGANVAVDVARQAVEEKSEMEAKDADGEAAIP